MRLRSFFIIFLLIVFMVIIIGCNSEPKYTAEEWEEIQEEEQKENEIKEHKKFQDEIRKFDKEYNIIIEIYNREFEELRKDALYYAERENMEMVIQLLNDQLDLTKSFNKEFKALNIPEPLDAFYYLKLEQANYRIDLLDEAIIGLRYESFDSKKVEDLNEKIDELELETDKEKRSVYREYDLDELI